MVKSVRECDGKTETEIRYFISSLEGNARYLAKAIRSHWGIENSLHWVLDVTFHEDECRIRKKNAPANFSVMKHIACNLLRAMPGKNSMRMKRKMAGWDDDFLTAIVNP